MALLIFEKFDWQPILTPGEPVTIELQNADWRGGLETGRPDFCLATLSRNWRILRRPARKAPQNRFRSSTRQVGGGMIQVNEEGRSKTLKNKEKGRRDERAATERV